MEEKFAGVKTKGILMKKKLLFDDCFYIEKLVFSVKYSCQTMGKKL